MSEMPQLRSLRLEHCDIGAVEAPETSTLCVETRQMPVLATEDICPVSGADVCPIATEDVCPVSTENIYPVSTQDGTATSRRPLAVMSSVDTG